MQNETVPAQKKTHAHVGAGDSSVCHSCCLQSASVTTPLPELSNTLHKAV